MTQPEAELQRLLELAKKGDPDALGELLQSFREHLRTMAGDRISENLQARVDESDLVQQSCLSAFRNFERFAGESLPEFLAWLRQIHERNISDTIRDHAVYHKRAVSREQPLGDASQAPQMSRADSPSHQAIQTENAAKVVAALEQLPESQREAVRLRHLEGCSLAEIAQRISRSEDATAGLVRRGLAKLRTKLKSEGL